MLILPHPTLNDFLAPEFVRIAKRTGYDAVNFRIVPFEPNTGAASIFSGNDRLLRETRQALDDTGIICYDIEVIRIETDTDPRDFLPLFEFGAQLGASHAVAIAMDSDESRVTQIFGELCRLAEPFGIRMVLEFMMRGGIRTLDAAHRIVIAAGAPLGGILVDALHFYRSGATVEELAGIDPVLFPYMQINDVIGFEDLYQKRPVESVVWKKVLPGVGDLKLNALLDALPAGIPISIEVPGVPDSPLEVAEAYANAAIDAMRRVRPSVAV